jgi:hypothetical protein
LPVPAPDFSPGDQLGARATAAGVVQVFMNNALLATFDITSFPHHQKGGRIGVNSVSGVPEAFWDDFGGGNTIP